MMCFRACYVHNCARCTNPEYPKMLQRPVNDQYGPSFLCSAKCRTGCAPEKLHCCWRHAREYALRDHQKRSGIVKTKRVSAGVDVTANLVAARLGDLQGRYEGLLRDLPASAQSPQKHGSNSFSMAARGAPVFAPPASPRCGSMRPATSVPKMSRRE
jgi:hypothetical protein